MPGLARRRVIATVGGGESTGAAAADSGAKFEAEHGEGSFGVGDDHFGQEDSAKAGNMEAVSGAFYTRTCCVHLFDERTKESSVGVLRL